MAKKEKVVEVVQDEEQPLTNIVRLENLLQQRQQLEIASVKIQGAIEVVSEIVKLEGEQDGKKDKG